MLFAILALIYGSVGALFSLLGFASANDALVGFLELIGM
jgi:hypothetical protein